MGIGFRTALWKELLPECADFVEFLTKFVSNFADSLKIVSKKDISKMSYESLVSVRSRSSVSSQSSNDSFRLSICSTSSDDSVFNSYNDPTEVYNDVPRVLLRRKSSVMQSQARRFFTPFVDKLRTDNYSLDFPTIGENDVPATKTDSPSTESEQQLQSETIKQLLYLRSRMSPERRKSQSVCDGRLGCACSAHKSSETTTSVKTTPPTWV